MSAHRPPPCVLALDLGSSSVRAQLRDVHGNARGAAARRALAWTTGADGRMITDAAAAVDLCIAAIDEALADARNVKAEVAAVAAAAFWHGIAGVDAAGAPVTPLFGWADARAHRAAQRLRARVDAEAAHARTGCWVHGSYPAARLLWLREEQGDTFRRAAGWMSLDELLGLRLFGERRCSYSMASGTGLFDLHRLRWDPEMLDAAGVDEGHLSQLVDADGDGAYRGLLPEFARRWPELAQIPWTPALGDGACATVGSGAAAPGRVALTVGTSLAVRKLQAADAVSVDPGLWCYRLDANRVVHGRAVSNGGHGFAWLRATLLLPPPDELERLVAAMEPDAHGLTVLPGLLAERPPAPDLPPFAAVLGMASATTPQQVVRAWMEATACRAADALRAVERAFGPADGVVADGGALESSPAWAAVFTDALGRPLHLSGEREATSRGAAVVALERLGLAPAPGDPTGGHDFAPRAENHRRYTEAGERQRRMEALLHPPAHDTQDTTHPER
ncbi:MAG: carbohydrate kinase [Gemmatimonadetes bacterium]|nr:carbohydrate kinase [Gemmatimonadota bacterium]